jgi:nucleotide-binding universal stress UspA family protein
MNAQPRQNPTLPHEILVAVDEGNLSDHAIEAALTLAQRLDAHVELVHAFSTPARTWTLVPDPRAPEIRSAELHRAREAVLTHVSALLGTTHGGRMRANDILKVLPGRPAQVVLERAGEVGADLIVLGALRRRPVIDFGSTARAVLAKSTCPVWVQPGPPKAIQRILVPVDLSEESLLALATARELAPRFRARVLALNVFDSVSLAAIPWDGYSTFADLDAIRSGSLEAFEKAMKTFDWDGVDHDVSFVEGRPADEILARARENDLVVMGTHGRTGFASVLLGSVAYEVLKLTTRPVMVVRKPSRRFTS